MPDTKTKPMNPREYAEATQALAHRQSEAQKAVAEGRTKVSNDATEKLRTAVRDATEEVKTATEMSKSKCDAIKAEGQKQIAAIQKQVKADLKTEHEARAEKLAGIEAGLEDQKITISDERDAEMSKVEKTLTDTAAEIAAEREELEKRAPGPRQRNKRFYHKGRQVSTPPK
jgi:hypothetical protein